MQRQPGIIFSPGFTLIELLLVLVILGALSAYALPRWEPTDTTVAAQADRLARDLRHAQALAMNQGRTLRFDVQPPAAYRVTDGSGTTVTDPADQQAFQVSLDDNVTLAGSDTEFDSLGRPVSAGTLLAADRSFTLNGNAATATVTLSAVTGFVAIILGQFSQAGQSLLLDEEIQTAGQLAQERTEALLAVRRDPGQGYAAIPVGTTNEVLTGNYAGYTRTVTVNEPPVGTGCAVGATCKEVLISVARGGDPRAGLTLMLVDY